MEPMTMIAGGSALAGLIGSILDRPETAQMSPQLKAALEKLQLRAKEGMSSEEEAAYINQLKGHLASEADAAKALVDKKMGGNQDTGAYMAALQRIQQSKNNTIGDGYNNLKKMDEQVKRQAESQLVNAGLIEQQINEQSRLQENAQKPWGDLVGSGIQMLAMENYLKKMKDANKDLYTPKFNGGGLAQMPGFNQYVGKKWGNV